MSRYDGRGDRAAYRLYDRPVVEEPTPALRATPPRRGGEEEEGMKKRKTREILAELEISLQRGLVLQRISGAEAKEIARKQMAMLIKDFGGTQIYLPSVQSLVRLARNEEINAEFDGQNHPALAAKHQLSLPTIYEIIAQCRECRRPS